MYVIVVYRQLPSFLVNTTSPLVSSSNGKTPGIYNTKKKNLNIRKREDKLQVAQKQKIEEKTPGAMINPK
jgi:hypothetical protein